MSATPYDRKFFDRQGEASRRSARKVVPVIMAMINPASVVDVGCGVGTWLAEFIAYGVTDVLGIDGDYVDRATLQIPVANFEAQNLAAGVASARRFDLAANMGRQRC